MSFTVTGLPIFVLIISILLGPGAAGSGGSLAIQGTPGPIGFTNTENTTGTKGLTDCTGFISSVTGPCFGGANLPSSGQVICKTPATGGYCYILNSQPSGVKSPLQYNNSCFWFIFPTNCDSSAPSFTTVMPSGTSAVFSINGVVNSNKNSVIFGFGSFDAGSIVVAIIGIVIAVAAVAGLNLFGSGESSEAIHILLMGGIFLGVWIFLTGLDGFATASPNSFFVQMNGSMAGSGTFFYFIVSVVYLLGFIKTVSRGM